MNPLPDHAPVTIWGLPPAAVHDRFWASRGLQVVRQGEASEVVTGAELYLLTDPRSLVIFPLRELGEVLSWLTPSLLAVRLSDRREHGYHERVIDDGGGRFARFERVYAGRESRLARVALTPHLAVARLWQASPDARSAWRAVRAAVPVEDRVLRVVAGRVYDSRLDEDLAECVRALVEVWQRPDTTVDRVRRGRAGAWVDRDGGLGGDATISGPVWVGAGRRPGAGQVVTGPAVLWDDPAARPPRSEVEWERIPPAEVVRPFRLPRQRVAVRDVAKRAFDVVFALLALALTLPFYPFIVLAILLEDGWPPFFVHRRETLGGREFGCIKFRTMRKDAEQLKHLIAGQNVSDGPQFFVRDDPRTTRVGKLLRKTRLDELPQFLNVLLGHMSVVGPRPSPNAENQFCPAWREARLSVRPGITGLWQVRAKREEGRDFQEWIQYDLEYVRRHNLLLDLRIIARTLWMVVGGRGKA